MVAINSRERSYEYTISFTPDQMKRVYGGWRISGCEIRLARPRQHRHENPSSYHKRKKGGKRRMMAMQDRRNCQYR